jgi:hypothetical protein
MGKGSMVRPGPDATTATIWRSIAQGSDRLTGPTEPEVYRRNAGERIADLLSIDADEPMFVQALTGTDPATGRTVITHRMLPFSTVADTPLQQATTELGFPARANLMAMLADHYCQLSAVENVRPLMPAPDEATTLGLIEGAPNPGDHPQYQCRRPTGTR